MKYCDRSWSVMRPLSINLNLFHMNVPHNALYQNCINDSAQPNMGATRALDKKSFK